MCVVRHTLAKGAFWRSIDTKNTAAPPRKPWQTIRTKNGAIWASQPPIVWVATSEERSNTMVRSGAMLWGVAARCIVSNGVKSVFVCDMSPGTRLSLVSVLQTSTGRGNNLGRWGKWCHRPRYRAKRTTEMGSREARLVKKWLDSVLTLRGRCCGYVG